MKLKSSADKNAESLKRTIIILPGTVVIFIPSILLFISHFFLNKKSFLSDRWYFIVLSFLLFIIGFLLALSTVRLFVTVGKGTPAPWDPPKELVIEGPYRYVRNPMISGVLFLLCGESLFFGSWLIFSWTILFFIINLFYFPLFEEKELIRRFGGQYIEYKTNVPRWFPKLTPYNK